MNTRFSKSILILAAAGLIGAATVHAGNGPGDGSCDGTCDNGGNPAGAQAQHKGGPAERMAGMARHLRLSLQQQKDLLDLFDLQAQDREQLKARMFEAFGAELCAQRDQHRNEVRALLNEEQLALHDQMMQRREERRADREGGGPGGFECPNDGNDG